MNINSKTIIILCVFVALFSSATALPPVLKAFLKSAILPGWGELSNGSSVGYVFLASEASLWGMRFYFANEAIINEDAAFDYAVRYGKIDSKGTYDENYYQHLSKFNSSDEPGGFNEDVRRTALSRYPNDSDKQQEYIDSNIYSDEFAWKWDNREQRSDYTKLRNDFSHNNDYAKTMVGVMVVNHLISGINSARIAAKKNKPALSFNVGLNRDKKTLLYARYRF